MAVTGAIFKTLTFNGESSKNYGVYITGSGAYDAPKRDVEMITIAGRNGSFPLDHGRFENIEVTYPAGVFADNEEDFAELISDFRNMLCSANGYCRLEDEYNPDEYRMAVYKSGLEVDPTLLKAGEFDITFECKPQRYLKSGEVPVTMGGWADVETHTGNPIILNTTKEVKNLDVELTPIQDLHGYDKPWSAGAGKNKLKPYADGTTQTQAGMTGTANADGSITFNGTTTGTFWGLGDSPTFTLKAGTYTFSQSEIITNMSTMLVRVVEGGTNVVIASIGTTLSNTFTTTEDYTVYFYNRINAGVTLSNKKMYFQLEQGSTATAYEPYSNICPITGHDSVIVTDTGKNLFDKDSVSTGKWLSTTTGLEETSSNYCVSDYIPVWANKSVFIPRSESARRWFYDASKTPTTYLNYSADQVYTPTADGYIRVSILINGSGAKDLNTYQIEYGTSASDYASYHGQSKTVTLPHTVYGAGVGVTSGSGKEKWAVVDMGTLTWGGTPSNYAYASVSPAKANGVTNVIADCYETIDVSSVSQMTNGSIKGNGGNATIYVKDERYSTAAALKTALSGHYLCYELATPLDLTTTPTDLTLYSGDNVISSDGQMTMEIGNLISGVDNPTRFEASPELQIKGYGTVAFNGYEIDIANQSYGEVALIDNAVKPYGWSFELGSDDYAINADTITVSANMPIAFGTRSDSYEIRSASLYTGTTNGTPYFTILNSHSAQMGVDGSVFTFSKGTTNTSTLSIAYNVTVRHNGTDSVYRITLTYTVSYDATNDTIELTVAISTSPSTPAVFTRKSTRPTISASVYGSKSVLGDPTIIDCENGEVYKEESDKIVPLNPYIDLGAELPKLAIGENSVTTTGSITECVIIPRWWKL